MILNYDCFRDVLLYIEEQDNMKLNGDFKRIMLKDIKDHFSGKYTEEDVQYCVKNLFDGRFLEGSYSIDDNYKYENCKIYWIFNMIKNMKKEGFSKSIFALSNKLNVKTFIFQNKEESDYEK